MAEIKPIKAWRYNDNIGSIDELTSPLFDVVSENQRKVLYQNPLNSIHLSVPEGSVAEAAKRLDEWKKNGVILQDKIPAIYVYYQYFKLAGSPKEFCRKGFVCNIRAYDWNEKVILRHENTIEQAVNDRIALLENTLLHASPTHGLYTDEHFQLEHFMDEAIQYPLYETEDYQGVRDVLAVIHDAQVIREFIKVIIDKTIILADGHHRYESSLALKKKMKSENPKHTGNEGYNFHFMYLTNTEAGDLRILPTHRLIRDVPQFNADKIMARFQENFEVKPVEEPTILNEIIVGKKWAFGIILKDRAFKVKLRPEAFSKMTWHFPEAIKELELTVLHYFIIEKIVGIPGKDHRQTSCIDYNRNAADCIASVVKGKSQMAIITQEVSIEDVKKVCQSGYTMPPKSTYFYPKVICGFLFSSVQENEFHTPSYTGF